MDLMGTEHSSTRIYTKIRQQSYELNYLNTFFQFQKEAGTFPVMGLSREQTVEYISAYTWNWGMLARAPPVLPARIEAGVISHRTGFTGAGSVWNMIKNLVY